MRVKIDVDVKPFYVKMFIAEIVALVLSFLLVFVINNYICRVQYLGKYIYNFGVLPSIVLWLSGNVIAVTIYAGLKNLKFIFLQIGVSTIAYSLFLLSFSHSLEGMSDFIFLITEKSILTPFLFIIFSMSAISLLIKMIKCIFHKIKKKER
jgi:hypothetical protein